MGAAAQLPVQHGFCISPRMRILSSADLHTIPSRSKPHHTISTADLPPPIVIACPACFCGVNWGIAKHPASRAEGASAPDDMVSVDAVLGVRLQAPMLDIRSHQNRAKQKFFCTIRSFV